MMWGHWKPVLEAAPQEAAQDTVAEAPAEETGPDLEKLIRELNDAFNVGDVAAIKAFYGPDTLLECAASPGVPPGFEFQMNPLSATIDGQAVRKLERYYTLSEETFTLGPLPEPNIFGADPGAEESGATAGYYLLLPPLDKGEHDIAFSGEIVVLDPDGVPV